MVSATHVIALSALSVAALSSTATVDAKNVPQLNRCNKFTSINWDDVKYACSWEHKQDEHTWGNVFIKRYNGGVEKDCICVAGINSYGGSWGSRWTSSKDSEVSCYSRDGKQASQLRSEFDAAGNCGAPAQTWVNGRIHIRVTQD